MNLLNPICLALDVDDVGRALSLAQELKGHIGVIKIGPRLTNSDFGIVKKISAIAPVFVDHKYFDIPSTMEAAVKTAFENGATFVTIHASSGRTALKKLSKLETELNAIRPFKLLAVTVLTSFSQEDLPSFSRETPIATQVLELAKLCFECSINGLVCSPLEVAELRKLNSDAFLVTPGIRGPSDKADDQKRTLSAAEALAHGANLVVVGRPILNAPNRLAAVSNLVKEIK